MQYVSNHMECPEQQIYTDRRWIRGYLVLEEKGSVVMGNLLERMTIL